MVTVDDLVELFERAGHSQYGAEAVTQLEHALQTASLARADRADAELIAASLLHDVGHLLHELPNDAPQRGIDDHHENSGAYRLRRLFAPGVTEPIRLHVAAKRYLCAVDATYLEKLSAPSIVSLQLQGGPMSADEIAEFEKQPCFREAVRLRRWDDEAKVPGKPTPSLEEFAAYLREAASSRGRVPGSERTGSNDMNDEMTHLRGVIFDWAGTTVDHGSQAPVLALVELFRRRDIEVDLAAAREPMGMAKRDHIRALAQAPAVARAWQLRYDKWCDEDDVDALYAEFLPLQDRVLRDRCDVLPGIPEMVAECRRMGLKIGSTTGYTRALMEIVAASAKTQEYAPDCIVAADDVRRGRPAPFLLFEAAHRMDVYPMGSLVAVDDTPVGIEAGRNAGCWTIGVTRTGNLVGLSAAEAIAMPEETNRRCAVASDKLRSVSAHHVVESAAEILPILREIDARLRRGELPTDDDRRFTSAPAPAR
jgi:phosphonoacetaldehyde hydrolase